MLLIGGRVSRPHKCMFLGVRSGRVGAWSVILFRYKVALQSDPSNHCTINILSTTDK